MADNAVRALLCIIEGDSSLFRVTPTGNMDIIELKNLFHKEKDKGILRDVNAADLVVWKVRIDKRRSVS
jgi:hypothetical protein